MDNSIKERALRLLLAGVGNNEVARKLKVHPSTISRYANHLVENKWLINTAPTGALAHYIAGPNLPSRLLHERNSASIKNTVGTVGVGATVAMDPLPIEATILTVGYVPIRAHCIGHRFKVNKTPKANIVWTKTATPSGVKNHVLVIPLSADPNDPQRIKIVYREGIDSKCLEIWIPEVIIRNPDFIGKFEDWAASRAQKIANWMSRKYGFGLGVMELCQDFHYAAAVPNSLAQAAKEIGLTKEECSPFYYDASGGQGEIETNDKAAAKALSVTPMRVAQLEQTIVPVLEKVVQGHNEMVRTQELLIKAWQDNNRSFENLSKHLEELLGKKHIEQPPETDPGGMFG